MHFFTTLSIASFLVLAAAVPHANNHHQHHVRRDHIAPLVVRDEGACGGTSGATCAAGFCCSEYGYCGTSDSYCGTGCQSEFGSCGDSTSTGGASTGTAVTTVALSPSSSVWASNSWGAGGWSSSSSAETAASAYSATTLATSAISTSISASISTQAPSSYSAPASSSSAAASATASSTGSSTGSDSYTMYTGDGTTADGWPAQSAWVDFDSMWTANLAILTISCTEFDQPNNSDDENADLKSAIQSVATTTGVDERFILAIVVQESKGCVRVWTTDYSVVNPGLMQSHDGTGSCNTGSDGVAGTVQNPCPASEITQMITDGTAGTAAGDGLKQVLVQAASTAVDQYYKAARLYNSGSIAADGNLGEGVATHCYCSDIANRLTGWVNAATKCTLDST